jgi:Mg2+ and Co2+ transporter CorA
LIDEKKEDDDVHVFEISDNVEEKEIVEIKEDEFEEVDLIEELLSENEAKSKKSEAKTNVSEVTTPKRSPIKEINQEIEICEDILEDLLKEEEPKKVEIVDDSSLLEWLTEDDKKDDSPPMKKTTKKKKIQINKKITKEKKKWKVK